MADEVLRQGCVGGRLKSGLDLLQVQQGYLQVGRFMERRQSKWSLNCTAGESRKRLMQKKHKAKSVATAHGLFALPQSTGLG
eukprot:1156641-Pelagomonas_calceolata.AAC.8